MRVWFWILAACLLLPVHARAQMTLEQDEIHVGDSWSYRQMDGFTNEVTSEFTRRVVAISDKEITTFQEMKGSNDKKTIFYDREWNLLDSGDVQYKPPMKLVPHPIHVGDTWRIRYGGTSLKTGQNATCSGTGKFTGVETVTVPAGTFQTGRIEINTECRGTDANAEIARYHNLEWYAPGIGRIIKGQYAITMNGRIRNKTIVELTGYRRALPNQPATPAVSPPPRPVTPQSVAPQPIASQPVISQPAVQPSTPQPTQAAQQNTAASYQETLPLAESGERDAEFRVGQMLEHGTGVEKDIVKAADWYRRSAENGMVLAMLSYGIMLQHGDGVAKDDVAGAAWIMKAAEAGQVTAQANLGAIYLAGAGLPRNIVLAHDWFLKSAQRGSARGMLDLAVLCLDPNGGAPDEAVGREWLRKSAQSGFTQAQGVLASKLAIGASGFTKDPAQAFDLATSASDKGDATGSATLGDLYRIGIGRPKDAAEAFKWYSIAARRGLAYAQFELAKAYLAGDGTRHDASQALLWTTIAAPHASDKIKKLLPSVQQQAARELSPAQQEDIKRQAAAWHPSP